MKRRDRQDMIISAVLFVAALAARLPFLSQTLYNWDSVNFALGLERFSVAEHQPHAPGYVLYVAAGRILQALIGDPNQALVAMSLIGSAAAVATIYLVGRSVFDRSTGLVAAILLMFSPLGWFYSEIALPYGFKLLLVMITTWFIYQLVFHRRYALATAVVLAVAAGFRQDVLLFLGPFWLYGTFRLGRRTMLASWAVLVGAVLAWLVPLMVMEGGLTAYRQISNSQYISGVQPSSVLSGGFDALTVNFNRVIEAIFWMFGPACMALLYPAGLYMLPGRLQPERAKTGFLLLLLVPAFAFFLLFLFDPLGYLLVYVTPLLLLAARGVVVAKDAIGERFGTSHALFKTGMVPLAVFMTLSVGVNTYFFIEGAEISWSLPTTGPLSNIFAPYSAGGIRNADNELHSAIDLVSSYDPVKTAVVTTTEPFTPFVADWRRLMYYLPQYDVVMLRTGNWSGFLQGREHTFIDSGRLFVGLPDSATQVLLLEKHQPEDITADVMPVNSSGTDLYAGVIAVPPSGSFKVGLVTLARQ